MKVARTLRAALAGGLLLLAGGSLPTSAADLPECARPGAFGRVGDWTSAKAPRFVERTGGRAQDVTTYAVDPLTPRRVFVTNGTSISLTRDGGCTWQEVFSLPETPDDVTPFTAASTTITEIRIAEDAKFRDAVWVLAQEATSSGGRPHVLYARGSKRGQFVTRESGLPPVGAGHALVVSPANADFLYLQVDAGQVQDPGLGGAVAAPVGGLYASTDGGQSWARRTPLTSQAVYSTLAVDPGSSNRLWAVEGGHLRHSTDGGRTFAGPAPSEAQQTGWDISALTVVRPPRGLPIVHAYSATSATGRPISVKVTEDGARSTTAPAPGPVESAASAYDGRAAVISLHPTDGRPARVLVGVPGSAAPWTDITPTRATQDLQVSLDKTGLPQARVVTTRAVLTFDEQVVPAAPPSLPPGALVPDPGDPQPVGPPSVLPARSTLTLQAGQTRDVTYTARLPHRPVPLDLYFLLDGSESMKEELPGVRADATALVADLRGAGVDVWAGVGWFRTSCQAPASRRELAVGPTDDPTRLANALDAVQAQAPGLETQLFALDQAVTGAGFPVVPPPSPECGVPAGLPTTSVPPEQQAGFRQAALKVVVHATDITFRKAYACRQGVPCADPGITPTRPDGSIDMAPAAADYLEAGVHAIGLAVGDGDGRPDLAEFARRTATLAPPGGVDCDGDGATDLRAGSPLVCASPRHLAPALQRMLSAVGVQRTLRVEAAASPVLTAVTPTSVTAIDVTRDLQTSLTATFSCVGLTPGSYAAGLSVRLTGGARVEPLGSATATVTCLAAPVVAGVVPPVPPAPNVAPVPAAPGSAPPPAVAAPAPAVQPQANPQVQTNPQLQTGAQDEQQEQVDLALALLGERGQDDPVPTAATRDLPGAAFMAALSGLALAGAGAGVRVQSRRRQALAHAR